MLLLWVIMQISAMERYLIRDPIKGSLTPQKGLQPIGWESLLKPVVNEGQHTVSLGVASSLCQTLVPSPLLWRNKKRNTCKLSIKLNESQSTHSGLRVSLGLRVRVGRGRTAASASRNTWPLATSHLPEIANTSGPLGTEDLLIVWVLGFCVLRTKNVGVELIHHSSFQTCLL